MDKNHLPESFGAFKPVGHTVIAYRSAAEMESAASTLQGQGFSGEALVRYTPEEMLAQADSELASASALAALGQELNLVRAQRDLAARGCSFLVVHAPDDERAAHVDALLRSTHPVAAQRYGRLIVEELVDGQRSDEQVFESPDRGLDLPRAAR
jgi:hypothetical protein